MTQDGSRALPLPPEVLANNQLPTTTAGSQLRPSNKEIREQCEFGFAAKQLQLRGACDMLASSANQLDATIKKEHVDVWDRLLKIRATGDFDKLRSEFAKSR